MVMEESWYELSLEMGLLEAVNEYVAMNGDIDEEELMEIFHVDEDKAIEILNSLGFKTDKNFRVAVPSKRHDIFSSEDLVEEILRKSATNK